MPVENSGLFGDSALMDKFIAAQDSILIGVKFRESFGSLVWVRLIEQKFRKCQFSIGVGVTSGEHGDPVRIWFDRR